MVKQSGFFLLYSKNMKWMNVLFLLHVTFPSNLFHVLPATIRTAHKNRKQQKIGASVKIVLILTRDLIQQITPCPICQDVIKIAQDLGKKAKDGIFGKQPNVTEDMVDEDDMDNSCNISNAEMSESMFGNEVQKLNDEVK